MELCERRMESSCQWLTTGEPFQKWQTDGMAPRYFWLKGPPATGKTILTASVAEEIDPRNCTYFFFKQGHHRSTLNTLFKAIAYQMATKHRVIREEILAIARDNFQPPTADYQETWRRMFINSIFQNWPAST